MKRLTKNIIKYIVPIAIVCSLFFAGQVKAMSLWEFYNSQGKVLPALSERAITAAEFGIFQYRGTAEQNTQLLQYLKEEVMIANGELLGYSVVSKYRTTLRSSMTTSQITVPVSSIVTADGHTLTFSDLGSVVYLTIEPGQSKEEIVKCTSIASGIWATCTRGLAFFGTSTAAVAANAKVHNAGSIVVMSNVHFTNEELVDKDSTETIQGVKTFGSFPEIATSTALCTTDGQFCTKKYVDTVGAGGFTSVNASSTRGLEVFGTAPETVGVKVSSTRALKLDEAGIISNVVSSTGGIQFGSDGVALDTSDAMVWTGAQSFGSVTSSAATSTALHANVLSVTATSTLATTTVNGIDVGNRLNFGVNRKLYAAVVDFTVTTTEHNVFSVTVPGGTLSTNNAIRARIFVSDIDGNGGSVSTMSLRVKYGTTTSTLSVTVDSADANNAGWYSVEILGAGATNSQQIVQSFVASTSGNDVTANIASYGLATSAIDSTANQTLQFTMQGSTAPSNFRIQSILVEAIQ